jgi:hypothetical protein
LTRPAPRLSNWLELLSGPRPAIRTVEVLPPSRSDESAWVFLTAGIVCVAVIYVLAFQTYRPPGSPAVGAAETRTLAFQVLFRDLPGPEQRVFRQMKEGLDEALRLRSREGSWPTVAALAAEEIPPFAPDVLDRSALVWGLRQDGLIGEYVGIPAAGSGRPAFLILMQEPEPTGGEDPNAGGVDEEHQLLPDGRLLHVTFWKHASTSIRSGLITDPALDGWLQIRISSPFQIQEEP